MKEHAEAINRVLVPFDRDEAISLAQAAKK